MHLFQLENAVISFLPQSSKDRSTSSIEKINVFTKNICFGKLIEQ